MGGFEQLDLDDLRDGKLNPLLAWTQRAACRGPCPPFPVVGRPRVSLVPQHRQHAALRPHALRGALAGASASVPVARRSRAPEKLLRTKPSMIARYSGQVSRSRTCELRSSPSQLT